LIEIPFLVLLIAAIGVLLGVVVLFYFNNGRASDKSKWLSITLLGENCVIQYITVNIVL
jgi:hypothetical protein